MKCSIFYCSKARIGRKLDDSNHVTSEDVELKIVNVAVFHLGNKYHIHFSRSKQIIINADESAYCPTDIFKIKKDICQHIEEHPDCLYQKIENDEIIIELVA